MQTKESSEAQRKFANAKSISSDQYFGDQNMSGDTENTTRLQKFAVKILFQLVWSFHCFYELIGHSIQWSPELIW
jgi:hypothetical protein